MEINIPSLIKDGEVTKIQSEVTYGGTTKTVWFSVENKYAEFLTVEKLDAFLVAMLLPAMESGEDIYVRGAISAKLYYNITNYFMTIISLLRPKYKKITIYADHFSDGTEYQCSGGQVTGFSAGIDSFCVIYDHLTNSNTPEQYKISHLVFNNVGSHGRGNLEKAQKLFQTRYNDNKGYPEEKNLEFIKVDSNLCEVILYDFLFTLLTLNVAAILTLQKKFSKYFFASAYQYKDNYITDTYDMATVDAMTVHLLSTETLECISSGCQYSRIEKTDKVTQVEGAEKYLNVCVSADMKGGKNCSECPKCLRTIFTLELLGKLEKFRHVFDLEKWHQIKNWYITHIILQSDNDSLLNEIREYAAKINYSFSLRQYIVAFCYRIFYSFRKR